MGLLSALRTSVQQAKAEGFARGIRKESLDHSAKPNRAKNDGHLYMLGARRHAIVHVSDVNLMAQ